MTVIEIVPALAAIVISLVFFIIASRAGRKATSVEWYYAASRSLTKGDYDATYLATNVTFTAVIILLAEGGYQYQWWALAAPVAWAVGMLGVRWLFLYKLIPSFDEQKLPRTLHEYCGERLNSPSIRRALAGMTLLAFVGTVAAEGIGLVYAFIALSFVHKLYMPLVLLLVLFVLVKYAQKSGFPGVLATDRLQMILVGLACAALAGVWILIMFQSPENMLQPGSPVKSVSSVDGLITAIGFLILFLPFHLCVSDMWQRCYAAKWDREVVKEVGSIKMILSFVIIFSIPIAIGITAHTSGFVAGQTGYVLLDLLSSVVSSIGQPLGLLLAVVLITGFVAGALSTADTLLVNAGFIFEYDWRLRDSSSQLELRGLKESVFVLGLSAIILVAPEFLFEDFSLVNLAYAVFSNQIAFTPVICLAIFATISARKGPVKILVWSLVCSLFTCVLAVALGSLAGDDRLVTGAPILGVLVSFVGVLLYLVAYSIKGERS